MPGDDHHLQYVPEPPTVSMSFVGWSALSALLLLVIALGGLYGIYRAAVPATPAPPPEIFPQPRVDTNQVEELHRILDAQKKKLEAWGWADGQHTIMQIPIERAMQLLAKEGNDAYAPLLPPEPALSSPAAAAQKATTQSEKPRLPAPATGTAAAPETHK